MSRRRARPDEGDALSLDSFLDIVTNVVGVLILIAVVTVLSAGDLSISTSASALASPSPKAARVLFECARGKLFFVDEEGHATELRTLAKAVEQNPQMALESDEDEDEDRDDDVESDDDGIELDGLEVRAGGDIDMYGSLGRSPRMRAAALMVPLLKHRDVGDANHRIGAQLTSNGLAWVYQLRPDARGLSPEQIERPDGELARRFRRIADEGGFVYFVVHDDSFEVFRAARALARNSGVKMGWHPIERYEDLKLSAGGQLGKRTQ